MNNKLHIAFATNEAWLNFVQRAIYDIIIRKHEDTRIEFYVLIDKLTSCNLFDSFNLVDKVHVTPIFLDSSVEFPHALRYPQHWHDYFGYLRLLIPNLDTFKDVERVLYLDVDVMARRDLTDLYNVDLDDKPFGCIRDCINIVRNANSYKSKYVDTGLILMDVEKMKKIHFTEICRVNAAYLATDYELINKYFLQFNKYLDPKYQIPYHFIVDRYDICKDIIEWNKWFNTTYTDMKDLMDQSYTWHFRGLKDFMYINYPSVKVAFDLSKQRLGDFLLSKKVMQWKPEDDAILTTHLQGL